MTDINFVLNGASATAMPGESLLHAARRAGVEIPTLCHMDGMAPAGNCRVCVVEIEGERVLAPSCCRAPKEGMQVRSNSARAEAAQSMVLELLAADVGPALHTRTSELEHWVRERDVHVRAGLRRTGPSPQPDVSHPAIAVNMDACINCTRCVRACRDVQVNDVIGIAHRGDHAAIVFDLADPMGESSCVGCGECVQACPTGALSNANGSAMKLPDRSVDSVCPYCGVGCLLTYHVQDEQIVQVTGRSGPSNDSRLCVKGRYGFDYVHHAQRLTKPLIRKPGVPKTLEGFDPAHPEHIFREASWEEALTLAAGQWLSIKQHKGRHALAGFGSAKGSNEEAYLFQKLVRLGFGNNNVDHCTRLCHASSVAALLEGIGSAAVSNQVAEVAEADVIVVIGSNPTVNHPVAATFMKQAAKAGKTLILMDPRQTELARHATHVLQFMPDTDVAMLNSLLHVIINEGLFNREFVAKRTEDFAALAAQVATYSPESVESLCGIPAAQLRAVARCYATARNSIIFWGMGISQHIHGTDNARCLIALALITGQIGRPGTGLHPLRGQNNVQGASDAGLIPMMLPDYRRVGNAKARGEIETLWGGQLDPVPGLTVTEVTHAILQGDIAGMYIMGENPAMSDPDVSHARAALAALQHLVVQDIFLTETCAFADVVLPASAWPEKDGTVTNTDRRVQMGRKAIAPPGDARHDLWIILDLARRMGLDWRYQSEADQVPPGMVSRQTVRAVYEEMRSAMPSIGGLGWERLERESSVTYPYRETGGGSEPVLFKHDFPTSSGRARLVPARFIHADEVPDDAYPFIFMTGRQLEHWHTGAITRHASILDAIEPGPTVSVHPIDLARLGASPGDMLTLRSRRGQLRCIAREDVSLQLGQVFMPFAFREAAANLLTNDAIDPFGKIPEFKFCAIQLHK